MTNPTSAPADRPLVQRVGPTLRPDPARTLLRPFVPGRELVTLGVSRAEAVVDRVLALPEDVVRSTLETVVAELDTTHRDLRAVFRQHVSHVSSWLPPEDGISAERLDLLGAYLTQEYAIEAAAILNPSIVAHPDQEGVAEGEVRFVLSLRAVGEGHISSLEFRTGVVKEDGDVRLDPPGRRLEWPTTGPRPLPVEYLHAAEGDTGAESVADACYRAEFTVDSTLPERVMFPSSAAERHGIEDVRLVRFDDGDGPVYLGTYTAYDGASIASHLMSTTDFRVFETTRLLGSAARDKGMALFPRPVGGRRLSIARRDRETLVLASSADGFSWNDPVPLQSPRRPWELIQLGTCAPPVETAEGWLVVTHGVGPARHYALGAMLLDLDDPATVRGVLPEPLLVPDAEERIGYVPNVVYTCGALLLGDALIVPYGCSDSMVRFARVDVAALLARLVPSG